MKLNKLIELSDDNDDVMYKVVISACVFLRPS